MHIPRSQHTRTTHILRPRLSIWRSRGEREAGGSRPRVNRGSRDCRGAGHRLLEIEEVVKGEGRGKEKERRRERESGK